MKLWNQADQFTFDEIVDRFQPVDIMSKRSTSSISPYVMKVLTHHDQFSSKDAAQAVQAIQTVHIT
jgi:hypothetical protein